MKIMARRQEKGQSVLEMTVFLVVIVAAFVSMQTYLKRGIQGRLRGNIDSIGGQYDIERTSSNFVVDHVSNVTTTSFSDEVVIGGENKFATTTITDIHYDNTIRSGYENVLNAEAELK